MIQIFRQGNKNYINMDSKCRKMYQKSKTYTDAVNVWHKNQDRKAAEEKEKANTSSSNNLKQLSVQADRDMLGLDKQTGDYGQIPKRNKNAAAPTTSRRKRKADNNITGDDVRTNKELRDFFKRRAISVEEVDLFTASSSNIPLKYIGLSPYVWTCSYWNRRFQNIQARIVQTLDPEKRNKNFYNEDFSYDDACKEILGTPETFDHIITTCKKYISDMRALSGECWDSKCKTMIPYLKYIKYIELTKKSETNPLGLIVQSVELAIVVRNHRHTMCKDKTSKINTLFSINQLRQRLLGNATFMARSWLYNYNEMASQCVKDIYRDVAKKHGLKLDGNVTNTMTVAKSFQRGTCSCEYYGEDRITSVKDIKITNEFQAWLLVMCHSNLTGKDSSTCIDIPAYLREIATDKVLETYTWNGKELVLKVIHARKRNVEYKENCVNDDNDSDSIEAPKKKTQKKRKSEDSAGTSSQPEKKKKRKSDDHHHHSHSESSSSEKKKRKSDDHSHSSASQSEKKKSKSDNHHHSSASQSEKKKSKSDDHSHSSASQSEKKKSKSDDHSHISASQSEKKKSKSDDHSHSSASQSEKKKSKCDNHLHSSASQSEKKKSKSDNHHHSSASQSEKKKSKSDDHSHSSASQSEKKKSKSDDHSHSSASQSEKKKSKCDNHLHSSASQSEKKKSKSDNHYHSSASQSEKKKRKSDNHSHSSASQSEKKKSKSDDHSHSSASQSEKKKSKSDNHSHSSASQSEKKKRITQSKEDQHDDNDESENDTGNRRLTNHSARRFMPQEHDDAGFEHNSNKQISGHKNIQSISSYSKSNSKKHHEISGTILDNNSESMPSTQTTRTVTINNDQVGKNVKKNVSTAVSETQVSFGNLAAAPTGLSCLFGGPSVEGLLI
ncbi:uncharacterized protein LOC127725683 isoform X3 [Mytilus californianus]|uniref:uncharacterized protein LOC127725683 isoform X3 n=1 Tax=Mytilus californianus TaxID=6549 RepID=UPI002245CA00|nr:uncharacterized protein LOC127725683 isoform X3 [Mytilus californianus]